MSEDNDHQQNSSPSNEELLVSILAKLCSLQGAIDALIFSLAADRMMADKQNQFSDWSNWFSRVRSYVTTARLGYLSEQYPQLRKLLEDHVDVGDRTAREIFDDLEAKFRAQGDEQG